LSDEFWQCSIVTGRCLRTWVARSSLALNARSRYPASDSPQGAFRSHRPDKFGSWGTQTSTIGHLVGTCDRLGDMRRVKGTLSFSLVRSCAIVLRRGTLLSGLPRLVLLTAAPPPGFVNTNLCPRMQRWMLPPLQRRVSARGRCPAARSEVIGSRAIHNLPDDDCYQNVAVESAEDSLPESQRPRIDSRSGGAWNVAGVNG
jgi:hypothetical protein